MTSPAGAQATRHASIWSVVTMLESPQEVATVLADVIATGRTGDVYTRPEGLERVLQYLRDLASGK